MFLLLFRTFLCKLSVHTLGSRVLAYLIFFLNWGRFLKSLGTTELNNERMKNIFHDIGQSLLPKTTCRKTSADESQRIRNAVPDQQIFLGVDESTLCGIHYLLF